MATTGAMLMPNTHAFKEDFEGMTLIEKSMSDYIYPWDGTWPMLETGLNYYVAGELVGETVVRGPSVMTDVYGNDIPGDL